MEKLKEWAKENPIFFVIGLVIVVSVAYHWFS